MICVMHRMLQNSSFSKWQNERDLISINIESSTQEGYRILTDNQREWVRTRDQLVLAIKQLGFPEELGEQIAKQIGSPKAMNRMMS